MKHILMEPGDPHSCRREDNVPGNCWLCDGGLAYCRICKMGEVELDDHPTCPGAHEEDPK